MRKNDNEDYDFTYEEACNYPIPFGKFRGQLLGEVAEAHPKWLEFHRNNPRLYGPIRAALEAYLKGIEGEQNGADD